MKYEYEIQVEAATENEADQKIKSLGVIAKKLTTQELVKLADIIQNDPIRTQLAKKALGV